MNNKLQQIYDDAGRPGVQAFTFAVKRAGLQITTAESKTFVASQSSGQVFQGRIPSDGKIVGGGREDMRWQMDLIDFSKRIKKLNQNHKYVLVAVDNYNRQIFTHPMQNKTASTTLEAFRVIIRANGNVMPKEITVDLGNEYALLEAVIVEKGGILRRKNMSAANTLAVVDRVIGKLKVILGAYSLTSWAASLKKATAQYNENSHSYLMGSAPNDVKGSQELQYELDKVNGEQIKHNNDKWRAKAGKLKDNGAFRTPLPRDTWDRVDAPKFAGKVHVVEQLKGANVESGGKSYPIKTILAVPIDSSEVTTDVDEGPGGGRRATQREMLQDYARRLSGNIPEKGYTLAKVAQILRGMRGFSDTADTYGPAKVGRVVSFLKIYPKRFDLQGTGPGIRVLPVKEVATSSGPTTERRPRTKESNSRATYRRFPNEQAITFGPNPGRPGGPRWRRYENYKSATTIGAARRLGATSQDIILDIDAGAMIMQ
jgi:hypothetical protein